MLRILVVEDDQKLNRVVCNHLNSHGYEATGCRNAQDAYDQMYHRPYALSVSDIMMPGIDGFEFAAAVRRIDREISILFMTARDDYGSKEKGYQAGIDDYMVKLIDLNELVLRIGALLRRANIASENKLTVGSFVMNADDKTAVCNGEEIALTAREFNTLFKLLSYPKRTFTRAQLMEEFWDVDTEPISSRFSWWQYLFSFVLFLGADRPAGADVRRRGYGLCPRENTPAGFSFTGRR